MRKILSNAFAVALVLLAATAAPARAAGFNFVSLGDWGCMPIGGYHAQDELIVAKTFMQTTASMNARFVLNPGDNFYYCGVNNVTDPRWKSTFEDVFTDQSTMVPWWSALGNHDYGYPGSATAQIEYKSPNNNRWRMPDRYYYERLQFPGEVNISLLVLDASPCQQMYIGNDPSKYDPCGTVIPGCPGCTFHENVVAQSCAKQLAWLKETIQQIPADDWKIAIVHAPGSELDVEDLVTPLQQAEFDLVVNGHVHLLAHYQMDGAGTWITSGAGCMVKVDERRGANPINLGATSCRTNPFHKCEIVWQQTIAGFATHSFSDDFSTLTTQLVNYNGDVLHTAVTKKGNKPQPNAPTPAPQSGGCCYYSDSYCSGGTTCCSESGSSYSEYECYSKYGKAHDCFWDKSLSKCIVA